MHLTRDRRPVIFVMPVLLFVLLAAAPLAAQSRTPDNTFQPWHSVMYSSVVSVELSPDGREVLFVRSQPRRPLAEESGAPWTRLYVLDRSGREVPFVTGDVNVSGAMWIDDRSIGFSARRAGDNARAFYRIDTSGGEARKIFEHAVDITTFDVSADGRWLAFLAADRKSDERRSLEAKGFNQEIYEEDLLFTRLRLVDLASGDSPTTRTVTSIDVEGSVQSVRFSPDAQRLLLAVTPTPLVDDTLLAHRLSVLDRSGKVVTRIDNAGKLGHAAWSPDGRLIAFIGAVDRNDPAPGRLMVVDAAGGTIRDLLPTLQGHVATFDWRDADTLIYAADVGAETEVGSVSTRGNGARIVVSRGQLVVTGIDVDDDGAAALVANTAAHPDELYTMQLAAGDPKRRTTSNEWLGGLRFAEQRVITYKARDGLELEGILIHPLDYDKGRRYPLVLVVHGGPECFRTAG